ncbi:MAG: imidazole glycerol phosphate synthase subunit HisF [Cyclobacteriaceae bacterium]|jgi:cyclase|nr:imidazole glycerol phosphate synthase subunit HisF [Cyclobacteriaceae bacterium]
MLAKRIIPCLDIKDGRTVKGVNFENIRDAGDPVALGEKYAKEGADELVFLDISATQEQRKTFASLVNEIARHLNIPFTVGGGISSIADAEKLLEAGADKVSINSAAVYNPTLIDNLAKAFGSQFVVLAIDAKKDVNNWVVHTHGGKKATDKRLFSWALEAQERGAGEILFTSMNHDGAKQGFANDALEKLHHALQIPVIASGGAGDYGHFLDVFTLGKADAALAASVFHFGEISVPQLKSYLRSKLISVR